MLILVQNGVWPFQFPQSRQVLDLDPDKEYPELHEEDATVPTVHSLCSTPSV